MDKPWEVELSELWNTLTKGRRWLGTSIVILFLVVPAIKVGYTFYSETISGIWTWIYPETVTTSISPDEYDVLNEWVAPISFWSTQDEAQKEADKFKVLYLKYEDIMRPNKEGILYPEWRDDILVARDPKVKGHWMVVIDTFYGTSSYPAVTTELARLSKLGGDNVEAKNIYQRLFINSEALCYSQKTFENTYGKISPLPNAKLDEKNREYPKCDDSTKPNQQTQSN